MNLLIDTSDLEIIILKLDAPGKNLVHRFAAHYDLSEKLIPEIQKFLKKEKIKVGEIKSIKVNPGPGGFSRIRTGVATANALAYGLKIKQPLIKPYYSKAPNITYSKKK